TSDRCDQSRRVLVVGVDHYYDGGARRERLAIAGLLVASVAVIANVYEGLQAQAVRHLHGQVSAQVIYQDLDVDRITQFRDGALERLLRVVSGHDDRDPLALDHGDNLVAAACSPTQRILTLLGRL